MRDAEWASETPLDASPRIALIRSGYYTRDRSSQEKILGMVRGHGGTQMLCLTAVLLTELGEALSSLRHNAKAHFT